MCIIENVGCHIDPEKMTYIIYVRYMHILKHYGYLHVFHLLRLTCDHTNTIRLCTNTAFALSLLITDIFRWLLIDLN